MVDQEEIHNQCLSDEPKERIHALDELNNFFSFIPDKQQAWNDLIRLTNDEDSSVNRRAISVIRSVIFQVPDKQQAWNELLKLIYAKVSIYAKLLKRDYFAGKLNSILSHKLMMVLVIQALVSLFSLVPDKKRAWHDLHILTNDKDREMRSHAAYALGYVFSQVPDKQQVWNDLRRLTNDESIEVRSDAANALGHVYSQVPDKQQAWNDLRRLTNDEYWNVRSSAANALGSAFSHLPDKQQAWNDLHRLTNDESIEVRSSAANALGPAFSQVPDKQQAWNDLRRLTNDESIEVRSSTANALGSAFSQVPDKQQAWNDLHRLTIDKDSLVRTSSNYSLGRVSIFKASQAETDEDYKKELEKAIKFFETAAKETSNFNPAQFCLPFYRSFYTIIFKKQEAIEEVSKYLEEAKAAIKGSESKKQLFEAVENLSEALNEVQKLGDIDLPGMKDELNFYRKYCDHAAELIKDTDEKAPFATEVLRKGLPILDRNLKGILEEIQKRAKTVCQSSQGTATEEIACAVNREVKNWEINNQDDMSWYVNNIVVVLKSKIPHNKENKEILDMIEYLKYEKDITKQYRTISTVIGLIPTVNVVSVDPIVENINKVGQEIGSKLDSFSQEMYEIRISLSPGIKQEIEISSGLEIMGTGATLITTIPLQEISYAELKEDLQSIKEKHINKLSKLPKRLANKVKGYLLLNDREDIVKQLM